MNLESATRMPDPKYRSSGSNSPSSSELAGDLQALEAGSKSESLRQVLAKPVTIVAAVMGLAVVAFIIFLQQDPATLRLAAPEAGYELLPNDGLTGGLPIAIHLGPLTVFEISDPAAGGGGAGRARQIVENLDAVVAQLMESPGRIITIEWGEEGMPAIVQKEFEDSDSSLEIVRITGDDLTLAKGDDPKLLARVWAERLTDSLRLLVFGSPPEFSRDTPFGGALDTLYVNATSQEGRLTTDILVDAFNELPDDLQQALTSFPPLPSPAEPSSNS